LTAGSRESRGSRQYSKISPRDRKVKDGHAPPSNPGTPSLIGIGKTPIPFPREDVVERNRVAVVTGGNRGIGLSICRGLAAKGVSVVLTARDEAKGRAAQRNLAEEDLPVRFHPLDVTDGESIEALSRHVREEIGRLDILVNNAGIAIDDGGEGVDIDLDVVRRTLETNLFGAWRLCQVFIPLMRKGRYGRIVNLSSGMGSLSGMGGRYPAYRISKTALNALTRILADELKGTNILVNAADPGWVRTEMGGSSATRPPDEGAKTPVWLALLPDDGPTGGFFRDRRQVPW
jgi:NAD(P)-dependent dehydrogenase (short-subunit alcohol dehydrogenase family)